MAQRNQALYSYEKTVRGAFKEVNDSLDAISRYGEQLTELPGTGGGSGGNIAHCAESLP